jgi:hypothetical protein
MIHHSLHPLLQENISNTYEKSVDNYEKTLNLMFNSDITVSKDKTIMAITIINTMICITIDLPVPVSSTSGTFYLHAYIYIYI